MPYRPEDTSNFQTWANDIAARLRATERQRLALPQGEDAVGLQTFADGEPLGPTRSVNFIGLDATLVGAGAIEVTGAGGGYAVLVAADDTPSILKGRADFVCDAGDAQPKIEEAMAVLATTGGVVQLMPGTFPIPNDEINVLDQCILRGSGWSSALIGDAGPGSFVVRLQVNFCGLEYVQIGGVGGGEASGGGVYMDGTDKGFLRRCWIRTAEKCIYATGMTSSDIEHNVLDGAQADDMYGMHLNGSDYCSITHNQFITRSMMLAQCDQCLVQSNNTEGATFNTDDGVSIGIRLFDTIETQVDTNLLSGGDNGIRLVGESDFNTIQTNRTIGMTDDIVIADAACDDNLVCNNDMRGTGLTDNGTNTLPTGTDGTVCCCVGEF